MSIKLVMAMLRYRAIAERKSLLGVVTETVSGAVLCDDVDINALVSQLYGNSISMTEMVIRTCSILRDHATEIQLKESSMLVQYLEPIMGYMAMSNNGLQIAWREVGQAIKDVTSDECVLCDYRGDWERNVLAILLEHWQYVYNSPTVYNFIMRSCEAYNIHDCYDTYDNRLRLCWIVTDIMRTRTRQIR